MSVGIDPQKKIEELERRCARLQEQLDRVKIEQTNYLQNVSHQLVAPLNAIKWHIENLTGGRLTNFERAKKVMRSVYSQSTIAVHLAKNFALMSNLEADHALTALKEPLQPVALCRLLINLADDFQPLGWDKNIQIGVETRGFESAPEVLAMKPLISQVFSNIIENAIKYSENDSNIRIDGNYDANADTVVVNVRNQGIPLPGNTSSVFERGFRSSEAKSKYPAGTGFGLYIAKRIVDIHQGSISAQMTDRRVVFTIVLSVRGLEGQARLRDAKNRPTR
jgi:two-component system phosphate regulon sensor histidine kinase PhoR